MNHRTAIVTGAGRGIGQATALELSRKGYAVALTARSRDELEQTRDLLEQPSIVAPADVSKSDEVNAVVDQVLHQWQRIDAVVHCAGVAPLMPVEQMSDDDWHSVIDTNLSSAFYLARACWGAFKRQSGGCIVFISSLASRDPLPGFAAYGAAKAAINLFGQALAREGEPIGVRVHTIAPGAVETRMFRALFSPQQFPADKALRPEQVAAVAAQCVAGDLTIASGETLFVHRTL